MNVEQEAQRRLESRASPSCFRLIIILLTGIWLFEFHYTLCVGFFSKPTLQQRLLYSDAKYLINLCKQFRKFCHLPVTDTFYGQHDCIFRHHICRLKLDVKFHFPLLVVNFHLNLVPLFKLATLGLQLSIKQNCRLH